MLLEAGYGFLLTLPLRRLLLVVFVIYSINSFSDADCQHIQFFFIQFKQEIQIFICF